MANCQGAEMTGSVDDQRVSFSVNTGTRNESTGTLSGTLDQTGERVNGK